MLKRFAKTIDDLLADGQSPLVAVSGGMDSVLLCHLLHRLDWDFAIAHCNFQLRGEDSEADEAFVRQLAEQFGAPFFHRRFDTLAIRGNRGGSIQMVARDLRYEWLRQQALEHGYGSIATAHHLNDSLETALYNLAKGTGIGGLRGILGEQPFGPNGGLRLIRPLLAFSKQEIRAQVEDWGVAYREDRSNFSEKYDRNKIRLRVVPALREINPALERTFSQSADILKEEEALLEYFVQQAATELWTEKDGRPALSKKALERYPAREALLFRLLRQYGFQAGQIPDIAAALHAEPGKLFYAKDFRLLNDREYLLLDERQGPEDKQHYLLEPDAGGVEIEGFHFSIVEYPGGFGPDGEQWLDAGKLSFPLRLRHWRAGDYFFPLGLKGRKKLKKYFADAKYSLFRKENAWILENEGEICALLGERIDERYKLHGNTRRILRIVRSEPSHTEQ